MRRLLICFLLLLSFILAACGNSSAAQDFCLYYPNKASDSKQIIGYETMAMPLEDRNYQDILNAYLNGPSTATLSNPFPAGAAVTEINISSRNITVHLNNKFKVLKDIDLSIACACLVKTVSSIFPTQTVILKAQDSFSDGSISKAYSIESFLTDDSAKELGIAANKEG